jgi:hypothetical protein
VVASKYFRILNGIFDVVYIDRGRDDGLLMGDVLMTVVPGTEDRPNGLLRIINPRESTSSAVVLKNNTQVSKGDRVSGVK